MVLIPASCTMLWTSVHSSSGLCLSDIIPWMYLSLPLYNHKGLDLDHIWMFSVFPYFLQFKSEFCNEDFMVCATVSPQSCFCWLYRASPSSAAKNIINILVISMCRVIFCVVGKQCLLWPVCSLGKTLLTFVLLHFVSNGKFACYSGYLLNTYFCMSVTYVEKDSFFWC